ncbi:MAG TPA: hypothetical protein VL492_00415 [Methylovirgula sp.]|jgi:hypothetical protein|nr:hypothetical protein [Methylovirgula sp.]
MTFVVRTRSDGEMDWKGFATLGAARIHCQRQIDNGAEKTEIWHMSIDDHRAAIAAIKIGEGILVEAHTPRASPLQIVAAQKAAATKAILDRSA